MKPPIFVRSFSEVERERLEAGLRSKDTFTLRRSQMLLASSRGDEVPQIARNLGCGRQTVRDAIHDFNDLADRVCRVFDCLHYEHLSIPQEVV